MNSGAKGAENGQFFSPNTWQMTNFLNPDTLIQKSHFHFLPNLVGFWGGINGAFGGGF